MSTHLHWFRNDLRLDDNEALSKAIEGADQLIPLFCLDPVWFADTEYGFPKCGAHRAKFMLESVQALREELQARGSDLVIRVGPPEKVIPDLCDEYDVRFVTFQEEVTREEVDTETAVTEELYEMDIAWKSCWGATLFHPDDLPMEAGGVPDVFTSFRKKVEKYSSVRALIPIPEIPSLPQGISTEVIPNLSYFGLEEPEFDNRIVLPFKGGAAEALRRLQHYFWDGDHLKTYKETRNGMLGADYSSKFSPWLANGCISPRTINYEVQRYESERTKNSSTYWMIFELIWRDYFRFIALKYGDSLFYEDGLKRVEVDWDTNPEWFEKWKAGTTGFPLIDANMRELAATGFMSNRGRQNVASFFAKNLNLDWRMGAYWFESQLIDYDVCSNWGNWAYVSGVGNDPRDRYFNIISQAERYDSDGRYVRHWLPELKDLPDELIHEPWKSSKKPESYPEPMIDLEASYERLRRR